MQKVRKAGAVIGALATVVIVGLLLLDTPGTAAQRGGVTSPPPQEFETLCVSVHNKLVRATSNGTCQDHEVTVSVSEDMPLALCVNEVTRVVRSIDGATDCAAQENRVDVTGLGDFEFCIDKFTSVVRVPVDGECQASQFAGIIPSVVEADSYESLPNIGIDVPAEAGLLANDAPFVDLVSADARTEQGGHIRLPGSDAEFIYDPPAGFVGVDSFEYTARIGEGEVKVPVTINVQGPVIWFVDNTDPEDDGDGTLIRPFPSLDLVADNGGAPDAPGDTIYVFEGNSWDSPYDTSVILEGGQNLIGQGVDLTDYIDITVPEFSRPLPEPDDSPLLVSDARATIELAPNTIVAGFQMLEVGSHGFTGVDLSGDVLISEVAVFAPILDAVVLDSIDGTVTIVRSVFNGGPGAPGDDGGNAVAAFSVENLIINQTSMNGGAGGGEDEIGFNGEGGSGLSVFASNVVLNASNAFGGFGGDSSVGSGQTGGYAIEATGFATLTIEGGVYVGGAGGFGQETFGGFGGDGLNLANASAVVTGEAELRGGDGGNSANGQGGTGGRAIGAVTGKVRIDSGSRATGGEGGDSEAGAAGNGGDGISVRRTASLIVEDALVFGNEGGDGATAVGGFSGHALNLDTASATVRSSLLAGGPLGPNLESNRAGSAVNIGLNSAPEDEYSFVIEDNQMHSGDRTEPSIIVEAINGSGCMRATGNIDNVAGSPPLGGATFAVRADGEFSISQDSLEDLSDDNNGLSVVISEGQVGTGCTP